MMILFREKKKSIESGSHESVQPVPIPGGRRKNEENIRAPVGVNDKKKG